MPSKVQGSIRPVNVLVVDDEKDIAASAREVLETLVPNCRVETADSCKQGLDALRRHPFDAVLVDYRMPQHSGLEFIREARGLEPEVPAILMTAYASFELATEAVNGLHIDGFLAKPIDALTLAHAVSGAVHRDPRSPPQQVADDAPISW